MKKLIALLLSVVMVLAFSACSGTEPESSAPESSEPSSEASQPEQTDEGKKLVLWSMMTDETQAPILKAAVDRFTADTGVEVEIVSSDQESYKTKLTVGMASDSMPDIIHNSGGGWLKEFVDAGKILDITDYLDEDGWRDTFYAACLGNTSYDGRDYGIPIDQNFCAFFYDTALFEQYNLTVPANWEDFKSVCQTLTDNGVVPISLPNAAGSTWCGALFGEYIADRIGGPEVFTTAAETGAWNVDAYVKSFEMMQEMVDLNMFPMGFTGMEFGTTNFTMLYDGQAAMTLMPNGIIPMIKADDPEYAARMGVFLFPAVEDGTGSGTNLIGGVDSFSVTTACEYPDEAVLLLHYLSDADFAADWINTAGRMAAVKGQTYSDPLTAQMVALVEAAQSVTIYYDQELPTELGNYWNDITGAVLAKTMTPQEAAAAMEAKAVELGYAG